MDQLIYQGIQSQRLMAFVYDGHSRIVEPHLYGIHKSTGNPVLRCFQVNGDSKSGEVPAWKLFCVDKMVRVSLLVPIFHERRLGYNPNDTAMARIYCRL